MNNKLLYCDIDNPDALCVANKPFHANQLCQLEVQADKQLTIVACQSNQTPVERYTLRIYADCNFVITRLEHPFIRYVEVNIVL